MNKNKNLTFESVLKGLQNNREYFLFDILKLTPMKVISCPTHFFKFYV